MILRTVLYFVLFVCLKTQNVNSHSLLFMSYVIMSHVETLSTNRGKCLRTMQRVKEG